jgi:vacuolar-type H+-ATPase subunit E/Vma4
VPVDRIAVTTAELEPIFALLDDCQDEAARIRRDAEATAGRLHRSALDTSARIAAEAGDRAERVRTETTTRVLAAAETERADLAEAAVRDVERVRRRTAERLPQLVQSVVDGVRRDLGLPPDDAR